MSIYFTPILIFILTTLNPSNCATFENVTVLLTTHSAKLFIFGKQPIGSIYIPSSDNLGSYLNFQPYEIVTIREANIAKLPENSISNIHNIVHLSITSSGIKKIEPGAFRNVPKLDGLSLEKNEIEEIKDGVFTGLTIKHLYLSDNRIKIIGDRAFNNMTMTLISLNNNQISRWDSKWFLGTPVGSIYLANNRIEEIPANFFAYGFQFKRINVPLTAWHLVLAQNHIRKIHPEAFNHVNAFGYLSLADNFLDELPEDLFHSVKNINTLDLTNNKLTSVKGVFDDINIHQLILINNSLSCFPMSVFDISRINFLFVDGNPFSCRCVEAWEKFQIDNNARVMHNMKKLEDNCVEK